MDTSKTIYGEHKSKIQLTVTPTAVRWLHRKREELTAVSLSDVLERLARQTAPQRPDNDG